MFRRVAALLAGASMAVLMVTGLMVTGSAAALYATSIPLAAMSLAKLMHAPRLTILLAGWSHNPDLGALSVMPDSEFDAVLRDLVCDARMVSYPGPWAIKRGDIDFGFSSGVQVDRAGNLNSVCIGDYRRPKTRLVGPILQPEHMALFGREYVMMPHHAKRNFVNKVDYVSGVGYPGGIEGRLAQACQRIGGNSRKNASRHSASQNVIGRMSATLRRAKVSICRAHFSAI